MKTASGKRQKVPGNARIRREIEKIRADLFTITEFCAAVRISTRQFHRIKSAGNGPRETRLGGCILIPRHEINRWLCQNTGR